MKGEKHDRQSIRLPDYDYGQVGAYFVTICANGRRCVLGNVDDREMQLTEVGEIAEQGWQWLPGKFANVEVPIHCVMPNHVHAIIVIAESNEGKPSQGRGGVTPPLPKQSRRSKMTLGQMIARYKYETTRRINQLTNTPGTRFWQRNYYERVIRNEREYEAIWEYIETNPLNWEEDEEYRAG